MKNVVFVCYGRRLGDVIGATAAIRKVIKSYKKAGDWHWNPIKKCETFEDWYDMETITVEQVKEAIDYVAT